MSAADVLTRRRTSRNESQRRARQRDPQRFAQALRRARLKCKYGLTLEQWEALFESQGSRCACCKVEISGSKHGWSTDHDHGTGQLRGIICHRCNRVLGMLGDTTEGVKRNTEMYLKYLDDAATR